MTPSTSFRIPLLRELKTQHHIQRRHHTVGIAHKVRSLIRSVIKLEIISLERTIRGRGEHELRAREHRGTDNHYHREIEPFDHHRKHSLIRQIQIFEETVCEAQTFKSLRVFTCAELCDYYTFIFFDTLGVTGLAE